ncbi:hypothetical protein LINPERHAP1_LOCUS40712 [Linum perenne]
MRTSIPHRRHHLRRAHVVLPHHGHHAPDGDRSRLALQVQAHPRILPPVRRPGGRLRRHGGRD